MTSLSIVFAGTPEFGIPCLNALNQSQHTVKAVYTQPDRPAGRGRSVQASAIKRWAEQQDLPIYQPEHFKHEADIQELSSLAPDVLIVIAYGLILPASVLSIPRFGCINVHASLLPRWRGASPIQHAILYGDQQSGITIMQMDKGMDTGNVLEQATCPIEPHETSGHLHDKLAQLAPNALLSTLEAIVTNRLISTPQNNEYATYAPKINKADAAIDWHDEAQKINQKIRAFNPWPIAYTHAGETVVRIHQTHVASSASREYPGTILAIDKTGILVATEKDHLCIERLQFPSGKILTVQDWLNTNKRLLHVGMVLQ